jgi:hypothetical protein
MVVDVWMLLMLTSATGPLPSMSNTSPLMVWALTPNRMKHRSNSSAKDLAGIFRIKLHFS